MYHTPSGYWAPPSRFIAAYSVHSWTDAWASAHPPSHGPVQACSPSRYRQVQAPQQGTQSPTTMGLPLFSPEQAAANGLGLLAAVTAAKDETALASSPLSKPGPYNLAASLAPKVLKRIVDLDFVEMSEVTVDDVSPQVPGRPPPPPARLPITDISQWIERYSLMAAVLCSKFPDKAGELFAYQASIVRAERNYEGKRWVAYDRQYRRETLARKDLNWSITDPRYTMRPSQAGLGQLPAAATVCRMTTVQPSVLATRTGPYLGGSQTPPCGLHSQRMLAHPPQAVVQLVRFAATTTKAAADLHDADTTTNAVDVEGTMHGSAVQGARLGRYPEAGLLTSDRGTSRLYPQLM